MSTQRDGGRGTRDRVLVIAEAGVNHNGDPRLAMQLVEAAAQAGADAVKFQTFRPEAVVVAGAGKAAYQAANTGSGEDQRAMLEKLALAAEHHMPLAERARSLGVAFLSTPFDAESADFLVREIGIGRLKIPSGEITNGPFLLHLAELARCHDLPIVLSTGMSDLDEVAAALSVLAHGLLGCEGTPEPDGHLNEAGRAALAAHVTLLHCTSAYPAPASEANLRAMATMNETFGLATGLSDHSPGIHLPIAAVALGASVIEKHFTLDRALAGPDHAASLEPEELANMIAAIRDVEAALGDGRKEIQTSERENVAVVRRSLVALRPIRVGEPFTAANLGAKRPGGGLSPMRYWDLLGRPARRDYEADELIDR